MGRFDISEIGEIHCTLNFDEDWYEEYLSENNLQNTPEVKSEYIRSQCDYEVEYYDSETFHSMGAYDTFTIDEIEEEFGAAIAKDVFNECMDGKEHSFEILAYQNDNVDLSNPNEVNAAAIKALRHGGYYKNCRGFILTNGVVVYTDQEHSQCTRIPGVRGTFDFIKMGNIRVLDHSIDIAKPPTPAQWSVLRQVLDSYYSEVLYLDLENNGRQYNFCNPDEVERDIYNYFNVYKISESQLKKIIAEAIIDTLYK